MREHSGGVGGRDQWSEIIPIGYQTLNRSCRVDLFLPFNCTDVAPKCDEDIVTEVAEPNRCRSLQAGTPPFFVALLGFINVTDSGNYCCCCSRTAWWPPQQSAGPMIHPPMRVDRMHKTSTNMHFATIWLAFPFSPHRPSHRLCRHEMHCCLCEP